MFIYIDIQRNIICIQIYIQIYTNMIYEIYKIMLYLKVKQTQPTKNKNIENCIHMYNIFLLFNNAVQTIRKIL